MARKEACGWDSFIILSLCRLLFCVKDAAVDSNVRCWFSAIDDRMWLRSSTEPLYRCVLQPVSWLHWTESGPFCFPIGNTSINVAVKADLTWLLQFPLSPGDRWWDAVDRWAPPAIEIMATVFYFSCLNLSPVLPIYSTVNTPATVSATARY